MNVRIHFFGMIGEAVKSSHEVIDNYEGRTIGDLEDHLLNQYPQLNNFTYQIALDRKIANRDVALQSENEVAILPPFAGG